MHPDEIDKPLSEVPKQERAKFRQTAEEVREAFEAYRRIQEVIEKVKTEELTLLEGQHRIDEILDMYKNPNLR